jgi:hypothetical protein
VRSSDGTKPLPLQAVQELERTPAGRTDGTTLLTAEIVKLQTGKWDYLLLPPIIAPKYKANATIP